MGFRGLQAPGAPQGLEPSAIATAAVAAPSWWLPGRAAGPSPRPHRAADHFSVWPVPPVVSQQVRHILDDTRHARGLWSTAQLDARGDAAEGVFLSPLHATRDARYRRAAAAAPRRGGGCGAQAGDRDGSPRTRPTARGGLKLERAKV
eukprot:364307-Chlamydomonas_euryale.AAC.5